MEFRCRLIAAASCLVIVAAQDVSTGTFSISEEVEFTPKFFLHCFLTMCCIGSVCFTSAFKQVKHYLRSFLLSFRLVELSQTFGSSNTAILLILGNHQIAVMEAPPLGLSGAHGPADTTPRTRPQDQTPTLT